VAVKVELVAPLLLGLLFQRDVSASTSICSMLACAWPVRRARAGHAPSRALLTVAASIRYIRRWRIGSGTVRSALRASLDDGAQQERVTGPACSKTSLASASCPREPSFLFSRCASKPTAVAAAYFCYLLLRPSTIMVSLPEGRLAATAAIDVSAVRREYRSVATNKKYDGYITGERGWNYVCEQRDWDPLEVTASTGEHIDMFLYYRADSLVRDKSMGHQICAAMRAHSAPTRGTASRIVVSSPSAPTTFGGNPASSAEVHEMVLCHKISKAGREEMEVKRVDPIEPCHLLRCWDLHFAGRSVERIEARLLMAYSFTLLSSNIILRYDELVILSYVLLLCSIALPFALSRFSTTPPLFALAVTRATRAARHELTASIAFLLVLVCVRAAKVWSLWGVPPMASSSALMNRRRTPSRGAYMSVNLGRGRWVWIQGTLLFFYYLWKLSRLCTWLFPELSCHDGDGDPLSDLPMGSESHDAIAPSRPRLSVVVPIVTAALPQTSQRAGLRMLGGCKRKGAGGRPVRKRRDSARVSTLTTFRILLVLFCLCSIVNWMLVW